MNDLNNLISAFSKEEAQKFVAYLEKRNKIKHTKNIKLFYLLQRKDLNSNQVCIALYNTKKSSAYHALRKRLFQSIINFSANSSLEDENSLQMEVIRYILAARNYLQQKQYKAAYHILKKAERVALEHHLFSFLNEIYHTQIQFAHAYPLVNLDDIINKFKKNKEEHILEDQLNIVYSKIKLKLKQEHHTNFQSILEHTLKELDIDKVTKFSFKSLYQLVTIVSVSAFTSNDYLNIESFLINTYISISKYKDKEKQPYYHIQILYHIANTLFRNKKFKTSKVYLKLMYQLMHKYKKKYYNTFNLKHKLLLALNLNYSNKPLEAIETLKPYVNIKHVDIASVLNIHLSLAMFYFQSNALKKAHQILSKLHHSDSWYQEKTDIEWVIKKNLMELLLHIDLGNTDLVESKFLSFKRRHFKYLKSIKQDRAITYIALVEQHYKNPENSTSTAFKTLVENSFNWVSHQEEDIFIMSYYAWLKSKIFKTPLYDTTLELVKHP
jgi:hypothetical protein